MTDSGGLMGVVTTGAGIVIMTGIACHTMRMVDRSMGGGGMNRNRGSTSYRRTPARARTTSTQRSTSSRRTYSRRR